jgi:hypothetical protein
MVRTTVTVQSSLTQSCVMLLSHSRQVSEYSSTYNQQDASWNSPTLAVAASNLNTYQILCVKF